MKPNGEALHEWAFWENLSPTDRLDNTAGVPPYDVEAVALAIDARLTHWDMKDYWPILDLGCGTGRLTFEMARRMDCNEIWGVDISQGMLNKVPAHDRIKTFLCDGRTLPAEVVLDGSYKPLAGAYSVTMFQHIPHEAQESYIFQVAQLLQLGARFVFTIAVGEVDEFLNHQASASDWGHWIDQAGLDLLDEYTDERGWHWLTTAVK